MGWSRKSLIPFVKFDSPAFRALVNRHEFVV
jgi:hypothetical protein